MRLFKKRSLWLPTWPVLLGGLALFLLLGGIAFFGTHDFLAVNKPVPEAKVMVVEAWLTDTSISTVADLLNADGSPYEQAWLVGPPLAHGTFLSDRYASFSDMAKASLESLGVAPDRLHVAPAADTQRHRTYSAGDELRKALAASGQSLARFDLVTLGVHARRSRLVYTKLFPEAAVGVIALPPTGYAAKGWFKTSSGMKNTLFEVVAYLYEKLADGGR